MSLYAYRIKNDESSIIYAAEASVEDRSRFYFCPNEQCDAHLFLCSVDGERASYFSAKDKLFKHIDGCPFAKNQSTSIKNLTDKGFALDKFFANIKISSEKQSKNKNAQSHNTGVSRKHTPRTLTELFNLCKAHNINFKIDEIKVGFLLLDERSEKWNHKGCFGYKIVECKPKKHLYDNTNLCIFLEGHGYTFVLKFVDRELYREIKGKLYNNMDKKIIVAGDWKSTNKNNYFYTDFESRKQIHIFRNII